MTLRQQVEELKLENQQLQQRIQELEAQLQQRNSRGAGRKQKLSESQIEQIKIMHASNDSIKTIAEYFKVSVGTVHKALHTNS